MIDGPRAYNPEELAKRMAGIYGGNEEQWLTELRQARYDEEGDQLRDLWERAMVADEVFRDLKFDDFREWVSNTSFERGLRSDDGQQYEQVSPHDQALTGPADAGEALATTDSLLDDSFLIQDQVAPLTDSPQVSVPAEIAADPETARAVEIEPGVIMMTNAAIEARSEVATTELLTDPPPAEPQELLQWYHDRIAVAFGNGESTALYLDGMRKGRLNEEEELAVYSNVVEDLNNAALVEWGKGYDALPQDQAEQVKEALVRASLGDEEARQQVLQAAESDPNVMRMVRAWEASAHVQQLAQQAQARYGDVIAELSKQRQHAYEEEMRQRKHSVNTPSLPAYWLLDKVIKPATRTTVRFMGNVAGSTALLISQVRNSFGEPTYGADVDFREWVTRVTNPDRYAWLATPLSERAGLLHEVAVVDDKVRLVLDGSGRPVYATDASGRPLPPDESKAVIEQAAPVLETLPRQTAFEWGAVIPTAVTGLTETYLIATLARGLRLGSVKPAPARASIVGSAFMSSYNAYYEEALNKLGPLRASEANAYALGAAMGEGLIEAFNPLEARITAPSPKRLMRTLSKGMDARELAKVVAPSPASLALSRIKAMAHHGALEGFEGMASNLWSAGVAAAVNSTMLLDSAKKLDADVTFNDMVNAALSEGLGALVAGGTISAHPGATHVEALLQLDRSRGEVMPWIEQRNPVLAKKLTEVLERADAIREREGKTPSLHERAMQLLQANNEVVLKKATDEARQMAQEAVQTAAKQEQPERPSLHDIEARRLMFKEGMPGAKARSAGGVTYELVRVEGEGANKRYVVRVDDEQNIVLTEEQYQSNVDSLFDEMVTTYHGAEAHEQAAKVRSEVAPFVKAADVNREAARTQPDEGAAADADVEDDGVDDTVASFEGDVDLTAPAAKPQAVAPEQVAPAVEVADAPQMEVAFDEAAALAEEDPHAPAEETSAATVAAWGRTPRGRKRMAPVARRALEAAGVDTSAMSDDTVSAVFAALAATAATGAPVDAAAVAATANTMTGAATAQQQRQQRATQQEGGTQQQGQAAQQQEPPTRQQGQPTQQQGQTAQQQEQPAQQQKQPTQQQEQPAQQQPAPQRQLSPADMQAAVDAFMSDMGFTDGVTVVVADSYEQVPEHLRTSVPRAAFDSAEAFIAPDGTVVVNSNNIDSHLRLREVLLHEVVGHYGLHKALGPELGQMLLDLSKDPALQDRLKALEQAYAAVGAQYTLSTDEGRIALAEELVARMAERDPSLSWVQRLIAAMRQRLRQLGLVRSYSDNDIVHLFILPAKHAVANRKARSWRQRQRVFEQRRSDGVRFSMRWYRRRAHQHFDRYEAQLGQLARERAEGLRRRKEAFHAAYRAAMESGNTDRLRAIEDMYRQDVTAFMEMMQRRMDAARDAFDEQLSAVPPAFAGDGAFAANTMGDVLAADFELTDERPASPDVLDLLVDKVELLADLHELVSGKPIRAALREASAIGKRLVPSADQQAHEAALRDRIAAVADEMGLPPMPVKMAYSFLDLPDDALWRTPVDLIMDTKMVVWDGTLYVVDPDSLDVDDVRYFVARDAVMRSGLALALGPDMGKALDELYSDPLFVPYVTKVADHYGLDTSTPFRRRMAAQLALIDYYLRHGRNMPPGSQGVTDRVRRWLRDKGVMRRASIEDVVEDFVIPSMAALTKKADELDRRWVQAGDDLTNVRYSLAKKIPDTVVVDGRERPTRNSEGDLIHETMEGIENFWRWFGDSKVVDHEGRPLVVYHGGTFDPFNKSAVFGLETHFGTYEAAAFRVMIKWGAQEDYGEPLDLEFYEEDGWLHAYDPIMDQDLRIAPMSSVNTVKGDVSDAVPLYVFANNVSIYGYYLKIENPKEMPDIYDHWDKALEEAFDEGHDGIIYTNMVEDIDSASYVIIDSTQAKMARHNVGTFDPRNPDVRYSLVDLWGRKPKTITVDGVERPMHNSKGLPLHATEEGLINFWRWFGDSKTVDSKGRPIVFYHGTVSDFTEFKASNAPNILLVGDGVYASTSPEDAYYRYSNPRTSRYLSMKVDLRARELEGRPEYEGYAKSELRRIAEEEVLSEHSTRIMPLYVRATNPVYFDYTKLGQPTGPKTTVIARTDVERKRVEEVIRSVFDEMGDSNMGRLIVMNLDKFPVLTAGNLNHEMALIANFHEDERDRRLFNKAFPEVMRRLGFDAAISLNIHNMFDSYVSKRDMHVTAYHRSGVKSVTGNRGTFDARNADVRFSLASKAKDAADKAEPLPAGTLPVLSSRYRHLREGSGIGERTTAFVSALAGGVRPPHPVDGERYDEYDGWRSEVAAIGNTVAGNAPRVEPLRRFDRPSHLRSIIAFGEQDAITQAEAEALSLTATVAAPRWHGGADVMHLGAKGQQGRRQLVTVGVSAIDARRAGGLMQAINALIDHVAQQHGTQLDIELVGWRGDKGGGTVVFAASTQEEVDLVLEVMKDRGIKATWQQTHSILAQGHSYHTNAGAIKGTGDQRVDAMADTAERRARNRLKPQRLLSDDPFIRNNVMAARIVENMVMQGMALDDAIDTASAVTGIDKAVLRVFYDHASRLAQMRRDIAGRLVRMPLIGRILNRYLRLRGNLPEEVRHLDMLRRGSREWMLRRAADVAARLDEALGDDEAKRAMAADYLEGTLRRAHYDQLDDETRKLLDEARDILDQLSLALWVGRATTSAAIIDNIGKHLSRVYGIHLAERRTTLDKMLGKLRGRPSIEDFAFDNIDQQVRDSAIDEMVALRHSRYARDYDEYQAAGGTKTFDDYARDRAAEDLRIILNEYQVEERSTRVSDDRMSIDQGLLRRRKDIPPALRKAMGEVDDAVSRFYFTVYRMSSMAYNAMAMTTIASMGAGTFLFHPAIHKDVDPRFTFTIAPKGSSTWRPLAGWMTSKEIRADMRDALDVGKALGDAVWGLMRRGHAIINWHNTVGSLPTQSRNFVGNFEFMFNNGWLSPQDLADVVRWVTGRGGTGVAERLIEAAYQFDMLDQNIEMNVLRELVQAKPEVLFKALRQRDNKKVSVQKAARLFDLSVDAMNALYRKGDDFFKLLGFMIESKRYAKALYGKAYGHLTDSERAVVHNYAANVVKSLLPNYAAVGDVQRILAINPVIGQFTTFQFEAIRTYYNYWSLISYEWQQGGRLRELAARRLAWGLGYRAMKQGLATMIAKQAGVVVVGWVRTLAGMLGGSGDPDEDKWIDAVRHMLPPWADARTMVPVEWNGYRLMMYDMNSVDPHARFEEMVNILTDVPPKEWPDKFLSQMSDFFSSTILMETAQVGKEEWQRYPGEESWRRALRVMKVLSLRLQGTARAIDSAMRKSEGWGETSRKLWAKSAGVNTYVADPVVFTRRRINDVFDYQEGVVARIRDQARRDIMRTSDPAEREQIKLDADRRIMKAIDELRADIERARTFVSWVPDSKARGEATRLINEAIRRIPGRRERNYLMRPGTRYSSTIRTR